MDPTDQDFGDDPDRDRLANGLEALFGTDPSQFNPGLTQVSSDGITTTFTHPQNANPLTDVDGAYQWSIDLTHWFSSGNGPVGGPTVTITSHTAGNSTTISAIASEKLENLSLRVVANQN